MAASTLDTANLATLGYFTVSWTDAVEPANFWGYRLYHRTSDTSTWTKIFETTDDVASYSHDSYAWANQLAQEVVLVPVTQDGTGALTEEPYTGANSFTPSASDANYWLIHPTDPNLSVEIPIATGDQFEEEDDAQAINLLGRGRKVNVGSSFGITGTLSGQIFEDAKTGRTAREIRLALLALKQQAVEFGTELFLRDPFGGLFKVYAGSMSFQRIAGTGSVEAVEYSIPYLEVT